MTRYFLGVDVGATKTHALVVDEAGKAVGFGMAGSGNPETVGYDGLAQALRTAVDQALGYLNRDQIAGAGFGVAGYDWPGDRAPTLEAIKKLGLDAPLEAVNDTMLGVLAGTREGWGVVITAGTGCNACGRDRMGREGKVTGGGWMMAENAGGTELIAKAVQAVALAWTQRAPKTALTEAFIKRVGAKSEIDLLEGLMRNFYRLSAGDAPLVFQSAAEGDVVATDLIRWAGRELASLGLGVIRQLDFARLAFDVALTGSLFNGGALLLDTLRSTILAEAPHANIFRVEEPPVIGAVILGMQQAGFDWSPVRDQLRQAVLMAARVPEIAALIPGPSPTST